jgi:hypothetical protein
MLAKEEIFDEVTFYLGGTVGVRKVTYILDDGKVVSQSNWRRTFSKDDEELAGLPGNIKSMIMDARAGMPALSKFLQPKEEGKKEVEEKQE